ncbi:hypothetical protein [Kitasatospora sp. NPDC015120]|uniref:hypothetical protein n=1 Tax=Kitasatospora sp. NPDC015120 TaxID=3364023 RepID=UPI0036F49286
MDWRRAEQLALRERASRLPEGWVMIVNPGPDDLPFSVSPGREFDAIAKGPDGGIVYEVVARGSLARSKDKLRAIEDLRRRIQGIEGWDLEVVILSAPEIVLPDSDDDIHNRISSAIQMADMGVDSRNPYFVSSAFVLVASALELTLGRWCERLGLRYTPNSSAMAALLVSEGYLDAGRYSEISRYQSMRNVLAHGGVLEAPVTAADVSALGELARQVDGELRTASAEVSLGHQGSSPA